MRPTRRSRRIIIVIATIRALPLAAARMALNDDQVAGVPHEDHERHGEQKTNEAGQEAGHED
jgi:hypothetical protein